MGARRASTSAVVAVVGGVLIVTLLVAWAAAIGPGEVLRGDGPTPQRVAPTTEEPTESASPGATADEMGEEDPSGHVDLLFALALGLQLLLLGLFVVGVFQGGARGPRVAGANAAAIPDRHPSRRSRSTSWTHPTR